jgi:hypothetical protein
VLLVGRVNIDKLLGAVSPSTVARVEVAPANALTPGVEGCRLVSGADILPLQWLSKSVVNKKRGKWSSFMTFISIRDVGC